MPHNGLSVQISGVGGTTQIYAANCPRAMPGAFVGYRGADAGGYDVAHLLPFLYREPVNTSEDVSRDSFRAHENAILQPGATAGRTTAAGRLLWPSAQGCTFCGYCMQGCRYQPRAVKNEAVVAEGGTVMLYVGDAVMATFGDPLPQADHAQRGLETARRMHSLQEGVNERWERKRLPPFHLGIGLSTGEAAAALLGSEERLEYTVVGDTVNLAQRLQQLADPGETVLSEATWKALTDPPAGAVPLGAQTVKGRNSPIVAYKVPDWR